MASFLLEEPEYYFLAELLSLYGPQIVLVAALSAITIYRRELSSNHVYAAEEEGKKEEEEEEKRAYIWNEKQTEEILNGAGLYCSGSSLTPALVWILAKLFCLVEREQQGPSGQNNQTNSQNGGILLGLEPNVSTGDLLELAGNYYCGEPVASLLFQRPVHIPRKRHIPHVSMFTETRSAATKKKSTELDDLLGLPLDTWIPIMEFLNPKDVISLACVNRSCRDFVDRGETANLLWKTLWKRDYGWILQHWPVGQRAAQRSGLPMPRTFDKNMYFRFGLSWIDYTLAGCNTWDECYVGIGGHVYDLTLFLLSHPGSPETVMVHAGQDATDFFFRIGHSKGARKLAQSMCIVVDTALIRTTTAKRVDRVGLRPTTQTLFVTSNAAEHPSDLPDTVPPPEIHDTGRHHHVPRQPRSTLAVTRMALEQERIEYQAMAMQCLSPSTQALALTQPKAFYDPLTQQWKAWYMTHDLTNIFIEQLQDT